MAFSVAALRSSGAIRILDTENVNTSFPGFVDLAGQVGLALEVVCVADRAAAGA